MRKGLSGGLEENECLINILIYIHNLSKGENLNQNEKKETSIVSPNCTMLL
jgi:hypothetical protein